MTKNAFFVSPTPVLPYGCFPLSLLCGPCRSYLLFRPHEKRLISLAED